MCRRKEQRADKMRGGRLKRRRRRRGRTRTVGHGRRGEDYHGFVEYVPAVVHDRLARPRVVLAAHPRHGVTDLVVYDPVQHVREHAARRRAGYVRYRHYIAWNRRNATESVCDNNY